MSESSPRGGAHVRRDSADTARAAVPIDELLDELEAIVYSGTKINVSYFIDEAIDVDIEEDIFEYFKESDTDDIETAMKELGDDYTEEEIRLVRIKFLSEMGN